MNRTTILGTLSFAAAVSILILFGGELLPRCFWCGKRKPRLFFKTHTVARTSFIFPSYRSVCRKCTKKYDLKSVGDFETMASIRRKVGAGLDLGKTGADCYTKK